MGRLNLATQVTPATPSAESVEIFADSTDKRLKAIDDAGVVRTLGANGVTNLASAVATSGTTETLLHKHTIPANSLQVGDTFLCKLKGVSSSTGTLIFRVRIGANGTTGDNQAWISTTSAAQVANAWAEFDVLLTVRTIGNPGFALAAGCALIGAVVVPQLIGAAATAAVVTTAIAYIDLDCTCSVGTFTAHNAMIQLLK